MEDNSNYLKFTKTRKKIELVEDSPLKKSRSFLLIFNINLYKNIYAKYRSNFRTEIIKH